MSGKIEKGEVQGSEFWEEACDGVGGRGFEGYGE